MPRCIIWAWWNERPREKWIYCFFFSVFFFPCIIVEERDKQKKKNRINKFRFQCAFFMMRNAVSSCKSKYWLNFLFLFYCFRFLLFCFVFYWNEIESETDGNCCSRIKVYRKLLSIYSPAVAELIHKFKVLKIEKRFFFKVQRHFSKLDLDLTSIFVNNRNIN